MNSGRPTTPPKLTAGLRIHALGLLLLLAVTTWLWLGMEQPHPGIFWLTLAIPIAHQVFVWLSWRLELQSGWTSRKIGYSTYLAIFFALLIGRVVSLVWLAAIDSGSMPMFRQLRHSLGLLFAAPALYTLDSVRKHFGFQRAAGADHFHSHYRRLPLVHEGAFRWNNNAMYTFGFLALWSIAIFLQSQAALLAAAFNHAYIWIHYYATEKPDLKYLYADSEKI